jgi:hypothetical protein
VKKVLECSHVTRMSENEEMDVDFLSLTSNTKDNDGNDVKNPPVIGQPRKVRNACVPCQLTRRKCNNERPCKRCVDRDITEQCRDRDDPAPVIAKVDPDTFLKTLLNSPSFKRRNSNRTSSVSLEASVQYGFWNQFASGLSLETVKKILTWSHRYSPMYISDMIAANSVSRRKYLNFVNSIVYEEAMFKVVADMARIASPINPNIMVIEKEIGVPYDSMEYKIHSGNDLTINAEFLKKISEEWTDVKAESDLLSSVAIYKVDCQEEFDETTGKVKNLVTVEFNEAFEQIMETNADYLNQYLAESRSKSFACNAPFWIFDSVHWDTIVDLKLYSFFNSSALMKGTFILSCWNPEFLQQGIHNSTSVNLIAHSKYDESFTCIQYIFGFRKGSA